MESGMSRVADRRPRNPTSRADRQRRGGQTAGLKDRPDDRPDDGPVGGGEDLRQTRQAAGHLAGSTAGQWSDRPGLGLDNPFRRRWTAGAKPVRATGRSVHRRGPGRRQVRHRVWRMQRVENIDPNPRTFEQRAATFAATIPKNKSVTLLVSRTESHGVVSQLIGPPRMGDAGALALAQAVGGKLIDRTPGGRSPTADDNPPDSEIGASEIGGVVLPSTRAVGWCEIDARAPAAHSVQAGANPAEVARLLAGALQPGQWAAVTLRQAANHERKAWRKWLAHRLGTPNPIHHSVSAGALVGSLLAGGDDPSDVTQILGQLAAALPGFDTAVRIRAGRQPWIRVGGPKLPAGVIGGAVSALGSTMFHQPIDHVMRSVTGDLTHNLIHTLAGNPAELHPTSSTDRCVTLAVDLAGHPSGVLAVLGGVVAVLCALILTARVAGRSRTWPVLVSGSRNGRFPPPRRRAGRPRPPHQAKTVEDHQTPAFDGDYPLHRAAFMVGPAVVAAVVAPQAGVLAGSAATRDRGVPPALLADIGPVIGDDPAHMGTEAGSETESAAGPERRTRRGRRAAPDASTSSAIPSATGSLSRSVSGFVAGSGSGSEGLVHLSAFDMGFGVAITGAPGTGKTKLMEGLWLAHILDRAHPSGRAGWPGRDNAIVAFDTKGDEVPVYRRWADLAGAPLDVVSVNDPEGLAIDMFRLHPHPVRAAAMFVDAMVYGFEPGSIMNRSQETLTAAFAGALVCDAGVCDLVTRLGPVQHPVRLAHVLCGGAGEELAKELFGAIKSEAGRRNSPTMAAAVEKLQVLFEPFSSSAFRNATESSRNKLDALTKLGTWWDASRQRLTWDDILTGHRSVVVDTGAGSGIRAGAAIVEGESAGVLAGMLMYGLWTAMKRNCGGWRAQNRWVSVFSDELSMQAATSEKPLEWMRDQGRSFGVRLCLATQRTEQLPQKVRDVFLTFPNLISYRQESKAAATSVADNVSQSDGDFTAHDIRNLAPFTAVCRLDIDHRLMPSFVCAIHNFETDPDGSVRMLGYQPALTAATTPEHNMNPGEMNSGERTNPWIDAAGTTPPDTPNDDKPDTRTAAGPPVDATHLFAGDDEDLDL